MKEESNTLNLYRDCIHEFSEKIRNIRISKSVYSNRVAGNFNKKFMSCVYNLSLLCLKNDETISLIEMEYRLKNMETLLPNIDKGKFKKYPDIIKFIDFYENKKQMLDSIKYTPDIVKLEIKKIISNAILWYDSDYAYISNIINELMTKSIKDTYNISNIELSIDFRDYINKYRQEQMEYFIHLFEEKHNEEVKVR